MFYEVYKQRPITPIYGTRVGIRDIYVDGAIKSKLPMRVHTTIGIAIENPVEWKNKAVYGEKVMLRPNEPMKLFYSDLKILTPEQIKDIEDKQLSMQSL